MSRRLKLLSLLFASLNSFALSVQTELPLQIVADSSFFDYKKGINIYEGNVKVDQGTSHLAADKVITKNNANHKIEEAIAFGIKQPAEFNSLPQPEDDLFQAKAKVIKYYPYKATIILEGQVEVIQGENSFQGPLIIYNIKDQTVAAPSTKTGRATIVIEPSRS